MYHDTPTLHYREGFPPANPSEPPIDQQTVNPDRRGPIGSAGEMYPNQGGIGSGKWWNGIWRKTWSSSLLWWGNWFRNRLRSYAELYPSGGIIGSAGAPNYPRPGEIGSGIGSGVAPNYPQGPGFGPGIGSAGAPNYPPPGGIGSGIGTGVTPNYSHGGGIGHGANPMRPYPEPAPPIGHGGIGTGVVPLRPYEGELNHDPPPPLGRDVTPAGPHMRGIGGIRIGVAPYRPFDGDHNGDHHGHRDCC
ncbi:hypothetical protein OSTOST_05084 [Ostertagia ostertagi]